MTQSTLTDFESSGVECPVCGDVFKNNKGFGPHFRVVHPDKHTATERVREAYDGEPKAALIKWHYEDELAVQEISRRFDIPRDGLMEVFDKCGIERKDWDIGTWVEENPQEHRRVAKENAHKGSEAREKNGMAGKTGQENPNWRGGKGVLDAVKKQLGPYWKGRREEAKERDGYECRNCGATDCDLDSHHIVPVMCGGTHGFWNLMTLCKSCHTKAEQFIRQYPEFDPVLVE